MLNKLIMAAALSALGILLAPTKVDAWGAAHVGYTHVGPSGVYHTGRTAVATPYGARSYGHTNAYGYGGGAYHAGYSRGYGGYGGGYRYNYGYGGGGYHYGYVR